LRNPDVRERLLTATDSQAAFEVIARADGQG
jgi:hypothetical protein